jgi:hypothetical protein
MIKNDMQLFRPNSVDNYIDGLAGFLVTWQLFDLIIGSALAFGGGYFIAGSIVAVFPILCFGLFIFLVTHNKARKMSAKQNSLYDKYKNMLKTMPKEDLPVITPEAVFNMTEQDVSEVKNKLDNLYAAWAENQRVSKAADHRISDIKRDLKSKAEYYNGHTNEMRKFEEVS